MNTEGSSPAQQKHANEFYLEPVQSTSYHHISETLSNHLILHHSQSHTPHACDNSFPVVIILQINVRNLLDKYYYFLALRNGPESKTPGS